jgi:pimeloyl-ACP methyl ester carboxylesterase
MMVAYAYAARYSAEVKKLVLMDAAIPGIEPIWSQKKTSAWWFGFFSWPAASELIRGRESVFLDNFWAISSHTLTAFTEDEINKFIRAYSTGGAIVGSFNWYADFKQDVKDNLILAASKLEMPVLAMGGEYGASNISAQCRMIALHVKPSIIQNAGHWLVEENTAQVQNELLDFFS